MPNDPNPRRRRRFLLAIGGLIGASAVATGLVLSFQSGSSNLRRAKQNLAPRVLRFLRSRVYAPPTNSPPGSLDGTVLDTLVTAVAALLEVDVEKSRYADFYAWRAAHLPGHRELYERAVRQLDQASDKRTGKTYLSSNVVSHTPVAREVLLVNRPTGRLTDAWYAFSTRDRFLFDYHIGRAAFELFAATDLYAHQGYPSWPGRPTGVEAYQRFLVEQVRAT